MQYARSAIIVAAMAGAAGPLAAQTKLPTEIEIDRCMAEEKYRDQLALKRYGQRTRDDYIIRDACKAEVARAFDDRILGRPRDPGPPLIPAPMPWVDFGALFGGNRGQAGSGLPVGAAVTGAVGSELLIQGSWNNVSIQNEADNRIAYFIDTNLIERGPISSAWLTAFYERPYASGEASKAYRVRVECATQRWAYQYIGGRDARYRVLNAIGPDRDWRAPPADPDAPVSRVIAMLCSNASPGTPLGAERPAPADWARNWFEQHPR